MNCLAIRSPNNGFGVVQMHRREQRAARARHADSTTSVNLLLRRALWDSPVGRCESGLEYILLPNRIPQRGHGTPHAAEADPEATK